MVPKFAANTKKECSFKSVGGKHYKQNARFWCWIPNDCIEFKRQYQRRKIPTKDYLLENKPIFNRIRCSKSDLKKVYTNK